MQVSEGQTGQERSREIFFQGVGHLKAGRLLEARACFETCLALTPERPSVLGNLGITLFHLGLPVESAAYLQQATAGDPDHKDAWACLGLAHEANGDWQAAVDALSKALELPGQSATPWFSMGQCLMRLGRQTDALGALDRALKIEPNSATAWSTRGGLLREMHRFEEAATSFENAMRLGADPELHAYYLASVRGAKPPLTAPRQYVEALFDDYAADFQGHVVDKLGYRGYETLLRPVLKSGRRFRTALDLGCGTGLCAPLLQSCADAVDGVDISNEMLKQARALGIYRALVHADMSAFLADAGRRADLVVAADVFIYVGDIAPVFAAVTRILEPCGLFAFTVELATNGDDIRLLPSLRYAHSEHYIRRLAAQCGLELADLHVAPIRHEQSTPVPGLYVCLTKPDAERP